MKNDFVGFLMLILFVIGVVGSTIVFLTFAAGERENNKAKRLAECIDHGFTEKQCKYMLAY